jgi:hypothetical protein
VLKPIERKLVWSDEERAIGLARAQRFHPRSLQLLRYQSVTDPRPSTALPDAESMTWKRAACADTDRRAPKPLLPNVGSQLWVDVSTPLVSAASGSTLRRAILVLSLRRACAQTIVERIERAKRLGRRL